MAVLVIPYLKILSRVEKIRNGSGKFNFKNGRYVLWFWTYLAKEHISCEIYKILFFLYITNYCRYYDDERLVSNGFEICARFGQYKFEGYYG